MSRNPRHKTISLKVYRHFAVVTLVVTALLAFFASGENREATAQAMVAVATPQKAPVAQPTRAVAFRDARKSQGWGSDGGGDGGDGSGSAADFGPGARRPDNVQPSVPMSPAMQLTSLANLPDTAPPGMPQAVFQQLKREQKRLKQAGPQVTTSQSQASMMDQSRQRSGAGDNPEQAGD
jgi:hypothetical protein